MDGRTVTTLIDSSTHCRHNGPMALRVLDWAAFANGTPPSTTHSSTCLEDGRFTQFPGPNHQYIHTHMHTGTPPASLPRATLVAEVGTPPALGHDQSVLGSCFMGFPGLWTDGLARDCWAPDDRLVGRIEDRVQMHLYYGRAKLSNHPRPTTPIYTHTPRTAPST